MLDKLTSLVQPDSVHKVKHYETYKSMVEMYKTSKINFVLLYTENIDMALTILRAESKITATGLYNVGAYRLKESKQVLVDKMVAEIYLSTRFLSLGSDKLHMWSKQELVNNMIKGDDNYPKTMTVTLHFLQYHNLRGKRIPSGYKGDKTTGNEATFTQDEDGKGKSDSENNNHN